jgi:hypothetical protein
MAVNNLRIGWLGTLAVAGCVLFSSAGRAAGDEMPITGWVTHQPALGISSPAARPAELKSTQPATASVPSHPIRRLLTAILSPQHQPCFVFD